MSPAQQKLLVDEVKRLVVLGYVVPSKSPWGSPVIFVPKPHSDQMRMCVDYRQLNKSIVTTRFPIPRLDEYVARAAQFKWFSLLDLKEGYHQLRLSSESQALTAFSTADGHYQFTTLPFGLSCAPMEFQRAMEEIFPRRLYPFVQIYIDDILILANTRQEALRRLETVLTVLRHHGLRANIAKCMLLRTRIHYLGHSISYGRIGMEADHVNSIIHAPPPADIAAIQSFLGLANYYRQFIPRFAMIAAPLYELTSHKTTYTWTAQHQLSFDFLKQCIGRMPLLVTAPKSGTVHLRLYSDASDVGIGAVLETEDRQPITFFSRRLSPAEMKYTIYERELLALISACEKWRHYILGADVVYHVDNAALFWAKTVDTNPRVARWLLRLDTFGLGKQWIPTKDNVVADWLSRYSWASSVDSSSYKLPPALSGVN
jgi:hypothetical protein